MPVFVQTYVHRVTQSKSLINDFELDTDVDIWVFVDRCWYMSVVGRCWYPQNNLNQYQCYIIIMSNKKVKANQ